MRRLSLLPLLGPQLLTAACGVDSSEASEPLSGVDEAVATSTHALIRIERSALVGAESEATGQAFAGIVRVPETADPEPLLRLSGKGITLPGLGACEPSSRERDTPLSASVGHVEFLAAGEVALGTSQSETVLAPRVFESSQTELSGVVYTSRDRTSDPLPGGASYLLKTTGSEQLPPLEVRVRAPELLSDVALNGVALVDVLSLRASDGVEVSWVAGDPRDTVYVEVAGTSGTLGVCAFRDSDGAGVLPHGLFGARGAGSLTLHRLREVAADVRAVDVAEVRFDFELTAEVAFR